MSRQFHKIPSKWAMKINKFYRQKLSGIFKNPWQFGGGNGWSSLQLSRLLLLLFLIIYITNQLILEISRDVDIDYLTIPSLGSEDEAFVACGKFSDAWSRLEREKKNTNNFVFWAITRVYWKNMVLAGICTLLRTIAVVAGPLMLYAFVGYSKLEKKNLKEGAFLLGFLVLLKLVESLSYGQFYFYSRRIGWGWGQL